MNGGRSRASRRLTRLLEELAGLLEERRTPGLPAEGQAFSWDGTAFRPVRRRAGVDPDLLTGVDRQKEAFYADVRRFLAEVPCHDVLLWGERGTGKSSLVRSLLHAFRDTALALLDVHEPAIPDLPRILDALQPDPRRWIIFLDDLAFRSDAEHYRELKVLLEGGLELRPANTLVVATSNRRHLVAEAFPLDQEIHPEEAVAETVSLADRFGLSLGFYSFDERSYLEAVARHLRALGEEAPEAEWRAEALRWAAGRGLRSGRTAEQAAREIGGRAAMSRETRGGRR